MKQLKVLALATTVAASSLSLSTHAESNTYFGVGIMQTKSKGDVVDAGTTYSAEYKKNNYKALLGKRINDSWSVEVQYTNFAKDNLTQNLTTDVLSMSGKSLGIAGLYHFNPVADYSPFVKLGFHSWDVKAVNNNTGVSEKIDGTDALYGVGLDGKVNNAMKYRLEFERMADMDGDDVDNIGIGLLFDF